MPCAKGTKDWSDRSPPQGMPRTAGNHKKLARGKEGVTCITEKGVWPFSQPPELSKTKFLLLVTQPVVLSHSSLWSRVHCTPRQHFLLLTTFRASWLSLLLYVAPYSCLPTSQDNPHPNNKETSALRLRMNCWLRNVHMYMEELTNQHIDKSKEMYLEGCLPKC